MHPIQRPSNLRKLSRRISVALSTKLAATGIIGLLLIAFYQAASAGDLVGYSVLTAAIVLLICREAERRSEEHKRLSSILDAATELAIFTTDTTGQLTIFNKGAESMLGYQPEEIVDKKSIAALYDQIELMETANELGTEDEVEAALHPVRNGTPSTQDRTFVTKDGRRLIVSLALTAIQRGAGNIVGFLGIAVDATERRAQEREKERLIWVERELSKQLMERNDELLRMDRTKDEFVATVSHEFRTPLTSIKGYLELLIDGDVGPVNDKQQQFLQTIERSSMRLARLVEDLLFAARVDAGGTSVAIFTEVRAADLIEDVLATAHPHAKNKKIVLLSDVRDEVMVSADPARLGQLLDNLTNNALKFTPEGGQVTLSAYLEGDQAVLSVSDTGMGIPVDEQPKLFRRFFRSRLATEHSVGGTGIGLAVVKDIADAHGGTLDVESAEGKGTTIRLTLPALKMIPVGGE